MVGTDPRTGLFAVNSATFFGGCMRVINYFVGALILGWVGVASRERDCRLL